MPGIPRIDKLRVIHLYEADFNNALRLLWARALVWNSTQQGTLNDAQSGSRPGHQCINVVISKEMKYLYARITHTSMARMDNDAKSCYDRIVISLANLISQKFRMPHNASKTLGETLRGMQFRLRTAIGESTNTYQHSDHSPVHGIGQGGAAGPAMWLHISSILMGCLCKHGHSMKMIDQTSKLLLQQWIEGILDDTSLFVNGNFQEQCISKILDLLQHDAQLWEQLLIASGGAL